MLRKLLVCLLLVTHGLTALSCAAPPVITEFKDKPITHEHLKKVLERRASFGFKQFPVGFWNYAGFPNPSERQDWLDIGFTLIMTPFYFGHGSPEAVQSMRKVLDWGHERDMKFIMYDLRMRDEKKWQQSLRDYRDHPAVLGFFIHDEPRLKEGNEKAFVDSARLKDAAPKFSPFISFGAGNQGVAEWLEYPSWPAYLNEMATKPKLDFLNVNSYSPMSEGTSGWDHHFYNLRLIRQITQHYGLSFWISLCCVAHGNLRVPSYNDLRWEFNSAICCGVSGVLWYLYYTGPFQDYRFGPIYEDEKTQTWYNLRRVLTSFQRRYRDLFVRITPKRVTFYPKAWGNGEVFSPDELIAGIKSNRPDNPLLLSEFVDVQGRSYVMLVNNNPWHSVKVDLTFTNPDVKLYSWNWDGEEYEGLAYAASGKKKTEQGLEVGHWLAPGQEAVYRVDNR